VLHEGIIQAYSHAIDRMFLVAVPVSVLSVIAALFIKQVKLRTSNTQPGSAGAGLPAAAVAAATTNGSAAAAESATTNGSAAAAESATSATPAGETGAAPPVPGGMH
jgi:hypothetical protein